MQLLVSLHHNLAHLAHRQSAFVHVALRAFDRRAAAQGDLVHFLLIREVFLQAGAWKFRRRLG